MMTEALFSLRLIKEKISRKVNTLLDYIRNSLHVISVQRFYTYYLIFVGLKKVTSDMQTHKNPALRTGPAPFKASVNAAPMKTVLPASAPIDKPPVFTRDGKKWLVVRYFAKKNIFKYTYYT